MTEEVINSLPMVMKNYICTLKKASIDTTNGKPMCESLIKVVNFDQIPNEFSRGRSWAGVPMSNYALYIDVQGKWYFVEFKNGAIKKEEVYRKLYDSLIMLLEWKIIPTFDFIRQNINYILVYNEGKYGKIEKSPARDQTYDYFTGLAKSEKRLFDIDKFEKYLFNNTHTYTQSMFQEKFVHPMEEEEIIFSAG